MGTLYLLASDGTQTEYDEELVKDQWQRGHLHGDTLCWKEGLKDWTPLPFYFSATPRTPTAAPPLPMHSEGRRRYGFRKNPRFLTFALLFLLSISLGAEIVMGFNYYRQFSFLLTETHTREQAEALDLVQSRLILAHLLVFIITGFTFLKWIYRANLNSHCFGTRDMKFSPGWSIGWYFVPFMNIFKPYQAMNEIWKVSLDPQRWGSQKPSVVVVCWWSLWLLNGVLGNISTRLTFGADSPQALKTATFLSIAESGVATLLCLASFLLVLKIYRQQVRLTGK
jgi:hypothetical protein